MSVDLADLKKCCMGKGGAEVNLDCDFVGLYFSAHWCPPCRGFTPVLTDYYNDWQKNGEKKLEIVFVSSDQDESAFSEYYGEMPWVALKYSERAKKEELAKMFGITGIPTLVILNKSGAMVTKNGRGQVASGKGAYEFKES